MFKEFASQAFPIDYQEVLERVGGDASFLEELLKIYVDEFSAKFILLEEAVRAQNYALVQELGHSLKGSSANLSLSSLRKASFTLEMAGREKKPDLANAALKELAEEFQRLKDFLKQNPLS